MGHHRTRRPPPRVPVIGGTCPTCGKVRYLSRKEARSAAIRQGKRMRTYPCGEYWHNTSWQPASRVAYYRERERPDDDQQVD